MWHMMSCHAKPDSLLLLLFRCAAHAVLQRTVLEGRLLPTYATQQGSCQRHQL
jgi:hypothetical protein